MSEFDNSFEYIRKLKEINNSESITFERYKRRLEIKARERGIPLTGLFELTPLCNFDCKMCYAHLTTDQLMQNRILTVTQWKSLIDQAFAEGMFSATLSGGECLTYPGFKELYLYLHSLGCEISVLSNGALLDEKWAHFFEKHKPARIQITLYGNNDESYERVTGHLQFNSVFENIKRLSEMELPLKLTVTPNQYLGEAVFDTIKLAKSLCRDININPGLFTPREETGRADHDDDLDMEYYLRIYRFNRELDGYKIEQIPDEKLPPIGGPHHECRECGLECGGGRSNFIIDWKGIMRPCNRLQMIEAYPLKDGFKAAWQTIHREVSDWPKVPECEGCAYRPACNTCAANMLQFTEPGKQPIKWCERTKYFVRHGIWQIPDCD